MQKKSFKPGLNRLLESLFETDNSGALNEEQLISDCNFLWPHEPFAHIKNFSASLKLLEKYPFWISYGGIRTGSTFITMALKVILGSITENFLIGWEGDFKEPKKFFELVESNSSIDAGILKIHRSENCCNIMLKNNKAKALVSIRDYPAIAASYLRMRSNPYSPIYSSKGTTNEQLIDFIESEIAQQRKKQNLPNTFFVREDIIRSNPDQAISIIAEYLGISLTKASIGVIAEKLNIESQRIRQKYLVVNSTGHSQDNFLHYEHVNPADQELDDSLRDLVFTHFGQDLNEDGYLK